MSAPAGPAGLTSGGVVFLLLAWGGIFALTLFCFYKLFKTQGR